MRILVVDDDRAVREALRRALTLGGYEVQIAEDGELALELIAQSVPDTVVLDLGPLFLLSAFALTFCLATKHTAPKSSEIRANAPTLANSHHDDCGSPKFHTCTGTDRAPPKNPARNKGPRKGMFVAFNKGLFSRPIFHLHPRTFLRLFL